MIELTEMQQNKKPINIIEIVVSSIKAFELNGFHSGAIAKSSSGVHSRTEPQQRKSPRFKEEQKQRIKNSRQELVVLPITTRACTSQPVITSFMG